MLTFAAKIPIRIHPFFWILVLLIGWVNSQTVLGTALWGVVIIVSVLVHEYGHALTAMAFGQRASIDLVAFGGATQRQGNKLKLWQEFIVVLNGPIAGLLLFAIAYQVKTLFGAQIHNPIWRFLLEITISANLFWTVLNLLPIHPLDGGRLLGIICEAVWGIKGIKIGLMISILIAVLISLLLFVSSDLFLGSIFLMLAFESYRTWQSYRPIRDQDRDIALHGLLQQAETAIKVGQNGHAKELLMQVRESARAGIIYDSATRYLAEILSREGQVQEAYALLLPLKKRLNADGLRPLHLLAYRCKEWKVGVEVGNLSYQVHPSYDTALLNAFCSGELGEAYAAVGWLRCALKDGLPNLNAVLMKSDFDPIRTSGPFQELILSN